MAAPDHPTHSISGVNAHAAGFGSDMPQAAAAGRYTLGKEIDRGGMGIIYRATDTFLGRGHGLGPGQDPGRGAIAGEPDSDPKRCDVGMAADRPVIGALDRNAKRSIAGVDTDRPVIGALDRNANRFVAGVDADQPGFGSGIAHGGGEHAGHPGVRASG